MWGVEVPHREGRDGDAVLAAARAGDIDALVVGGVSLDDLSDPAAAEAALDAAGFVVSLELRDTRGHRPRRRRAARSPRWRRSPAAS